MQHTCMGETASYNNEAALLLCVFHQPTPNCWPPLQPQNDCRTALMYAAEGGESEVAELLLAMGADPNLQSRVRIGYKGMSVPQ